MSCVNCFVSIYYTNVSLIYRRLKGKYESDLQNLEQTERITREKYNETRTKLAECEANKQNMQSTVKQLELQLSHAQKVIFLIN